MTLAHSDPSEDPRTVTIDCYRLYPDPGGPGARVWTHLPGLQGLASFQVRPNERGEKLDLGIRFELERRSERISVLVLYNAYVLPIETYLDELLTGLEEVWPEISGPVGKWRETAVGVMQPSTPDAGGSDGQKQQPRVRHVYASGTGTPATAPAGAQEQKSGSSVVSDNRRYKPGDSVLQRGRPGRKPDRLYDAAFQRIEAGEMKQDKARESFFSEAGINKPSSDDIKAFNTAMRRRRNDKMTTK